MNDEYANSGAGPFHTISIAVESAVNDRIPASERMEKKRGCFGLFKLLARRRSSLVSLITVVITSIAIFLAAGILVFVVIGVGTTAKGVVYNGPTRMPWTSPDSYRASQMSSMGTTVKLAGGTVVERVVEPGGEMETIDQVLMLLDDLHSGTHISGMHTVTKEDVLRGYLPWRPFERAPRANFTLAAMKALVRKEYGDSDDTCVCYKSYMIPFDIVYLVEEDEVLYSPTVVAKSSDTRRFERECKIHKLVRRARREDGWAEDVFYETALSGKIAYVTERGKLRRLQVEAPVFPCIEHCLSIFDEPAPPPDAGAEVEPIVNK